MSHSTQVAELLQRGIAAARAGQKREAHQALLKVIELEERNEQAWLWLSGVVDSREEQRICLENVLAINPDNAHAQAGLHWLDQQSPPSPVAQDHCPRCQSLVPLSDTTCPHCGQFLIIPCPNCEEYVDVKETTCPRCGQSLGDFRDGALYHLKLAQAYLEHQRIPQVEEALARIETESLDDPQMMEELGALYERMKQMDRAIAIYEQAIERDSDNAIFYARLGAIYRQRAMPSEARKMYEQAAERAGDDPTVLFGLAQSCVEDDATPKALKLLKKIVRLNPECAPAHLLLGDVYLERGRRKRANRHYEQACKLTSPDSQIGQEARRKLAGPEAFLVAPNQVRRGGIPSRQSHFRPRERPGCVTVYAVLLCISAVLIGLGGILTGSGNSMAARDLVNGEEFVSSFGLTSSIISIIIAILYFLLAMGLWSLKNWARIIAIGLNILNFLSSLLPTVLVVSALDLYGHRILLSSYICGVIIYALVEVYTIFWFITNREYFD